MANRNYYLSPKSRKPKKSQAEVYLERQKQFLDLIHERKEIRDYDLKRVLFNVGWGPGTYERMRRDVKDAIKEVEYVKKEKKWISVHPQTVEFPELEESAVKSIDYAVPPTIKNTHT